jgi:hypothetical protein
VADEWEFTRKLFFTGHVSMPERRALPAGRARASVLRSVVEEELRSGHAFRAWWLPDDSMSGCEIQYRGEAPGRVIWRYSGIDGEQGGVQDHGSTAEAADALVREAREFFGDDIDGVPIDWSA